MATYGGSTTTFDHADWLGTERYRTTAAGGFAESCQSLVFGDGYSCTGGDASPLHFTGKEHDAESNLENFGARYYNSRYGRFVTPDWSDDPEPIPYADLTNPQTLNQYVIVHDNPNTFADLDGHEDDDGGGNDTGGSADYFAILLGLGDPIPTVAQQPPPPPPCNPPNADSSDKSQTFLGKLGDMIFVKAAVGVGLGLDVTVDGLSGTAEVSAKSEGQVTLSGKVDVSTNLQAAVSGKLPNGTEVGVGITKSDVTVQNGQAVVNSQSTTQVGLLANHGQAGSELNSSQATVFQLGVCLILCLEVGVGINKP